MSQCCSSPRGLQMWAVVMALFAIGCFSVAIFLPRMIDRQLSEGIEDAIVITADSQSENNKAYRTYVDPTDPDATPIWYTTYLYHVTNAAAVALSGATPDVKEMGPYVYRYVRRPSNRSLRFNSFD